jgi:hypothetical protein
MVDGEQTYGQFVVARTREIVEDVTMNLPTENEDGDPIIVPFPETLVWGDSRQDKLLTSDVGQDWGPHLPDLVGRMAKEGVMLVLGVSSDLGMAVQEPLFGMVADLAASMYARGYMIGLLGGADAAPDDVDMEEYLRNVETDIDEQVEKLNGLMESFEFDDEGETE